MNEETEADKITSLEVEMRFLRAAIEELRLELRELKLGGSVGFEKFQTKVNTIFAVLATVGLTLTAVAGWLLVTVIALQQEVVVNAHRLTYLEQSEPRGPR